MYSTFDGEVHRLRGRVTDDRLFMGNPKEEALASHCLEVLRDSEDLSMRLAVRPGEEFHSDGVMAQSVRRGIVQIQLHILGGESSPALKRDFALTDLRADRHRGLFLTERTEFDQDDAARPVRYLLSLFHRDTGGRAARQSNGSTECENDGDGGPNLRVDLHGILLLCVPAVVPAIPLSPQKRV